VDPRAGLDEVEKRKFLTFLGLKLRPLGLPVRSQSLYRLQYYCSYQGIDGRVIHTDRLCGCGLDSCSPDTVHWQALVSVLMKCGVP
jgi:hypothetical protein